MTFTGRSTQQSKNAQFLRSQLIENSCIFKVGGERGGGGVGKDENTKRGGETDDIHPPMGGTGECHMLD